MAIHHNRKTRIQSVRKVIAVDVDGTIHRGGDPVESVIAWCRQKKADGYSLILWSAQGEAHARHVAETFKISDLFDHVISKPGIILDDKGWSWIAFTRALSPDDLPIS